MYCLIYGCLRKPRNGPYFSRQGFATGESSLPVLFIMCAGGFSSLICRSEQRGLMKGCKVVKGAPVVSHMLFADDSYLYCKATEVEAQHLLNCYEQASGQKINMEKKLIFFSANTCDSVRIRVFSMMGVE